MKKMFQKISVVFESRATVFFATLALCSMLFVAFLLNQDLRNKLRGNKKLSLIPKISASESSGLIKRCFADMSSSSKKFRDDAPWSLFGMPEIMSRGSDNPIEKPLRAFLDINGDGLLDFIYDYREGPNRRYINKESCVMLSNGQGWDVAYHCRANYSNVDASWTYFGDCAG